jgi:diguanylate cyclase (GGDEF)-like protein
MVFAVGWNSNGVKLSGNLILALAFLAVGLLDFFHTITYIGMPDVISPNDIQKHLYFWLAARLIVAFTLLFVAVGLRQFYTSPLVRYCLLACVLCMTLGLSSIVIYHQAWLPDMFIIGEGLSPLKRGLEYFISLVNVVAALLLLIRMRKPQTFNIVYLFGAACTLAMSEYYFAIYTTMTGSYNILGHIYKVVAYVLIYRGIVAEIIDEPYALLKRSENALLVSKAQHERLASNIPIGVYLLRSTPDGMLSFEYISEQFCKLLNVSHQQMFALPRAHLQFVVPEDRDRWVQLSQFALKALKPFSWEGRILVDGETTWLLVESNPEKQDNGDHLWDGVVIDITARKNDQSEMLRQQANHDQLTLLPNRRLFMDRLEQALKKSERGSQSVALLFLDLDHFKEVNDTQGHDVGDLMLVEVAKRIKSCVRDYDTVARFGGDEFTVILSDCLNPSNIERIAGDILNILSKPFELRGKTFFICASIGIAIYPQDGTSAIDLLKSADQAMYQAKTNGRGRFHFFTYALQEALQARILLSEKLRDALGLRQMEVFYQPIVNLGDGSITKAEALLRWNDPEQGQIAPSIFIPIAEDNGAIHEIGDWVFDQVILRTKNIKATLGMDCQISINMSPAQFKRHSNGHWIDKLKSADLPSKCIAIEITEGLLLTDVDNISQRLMQFRKDGVTISIDDFGTGYSSLSYLKDLPLDYLKIDQAFVSKLAIENQSTALCKAIIDLAHTLNLKVVAEGIETTEQCDLLKQMGCDYGQGYLFSRPVPASEFEALLH